MFLKRLALRGFKSFADRTILELEPGITVIVGPNGSGKSNIVDALTWVLGTHSAKTLRGGAMADVIFAGAGSSPRGHGARPALGRAAVEITLDNARGVLPIDFTEVTLGRSMFTTGENAYSINHTDCRLLDVQELLSDTGLGRENHTIVGQGQLDAVLSARPEDRRALLEEAAGILKHRRRKERALRKLEQLDSHLERLDDILRELRRRLRPLERQAQAAGRHAELSAELDAVRLRRAVLELMVLSRRDAVERAARAAADQRLSALDERLRELRGAEAAVERDLAVLSPAAQQAAQVHFRLSSAAERARGLTERIEERRAGLADAVDEPVAGRDPGDLRDRAAEERAGCDALAARCDEARAELAAAGARRQSAEQARRAHAQEAAVAARARAEARERLLRWEGAVATVTSSLSQASGESDRLAAQMADLRARAEGLDRDVARGEAELADLDAEVGGHGAAVEAANEVLARHRDAASGCREAERDLERRCAALEARAEALRPPAGAEDRGEHLRGPLTQHVKPADGAVPALAALLGPLGEALVADGREQAGEAVRSAAGRGAALLVLAAADPIEARDDPRTAGLRAAGAFPAGDLVVGDERVAAALRPVLAAAWVVDDLDLACDLAGRHPDLQFVTREGALAGPRGYASGIAQQGAVVRRAAADAATAEAARTRAALEDARRAREGAERLARAAADAATTADRALQAARGSRSGATAALQRSRTAAAAATRELAARRREADALAARTAEQQQRLADLERRGPGDLPPDEDAEQRGDVVAERLEDSLAAAREAETQARLAVGAAEQRGAEAERRVAALEREAADVERRLAERERRRSARRAALTRCGALAAVAADLLARGETSLAQAAGERDRLEADRGGRQRELGGLRARIRDAEHEREGLVAQRHDDDLRGAERRSALAAVRARIAGLGQNVDDLDGVEGDDAELAALEADLERRVALLGAVNPLAGEEFDAVSERHAFLTEQIEDVRRSRRDLEEVVAAVDARVREVFGAAFADVAEQFARLFPLLFPGGEGRLVLTDPDDLLTTGIEVEARPAGKRVKRLSLLSGGERSLAALAVLFAIFAARPSPFYVLDEVEAALDDVNLQRFLDVLAEFAESAQLLVVTHQKRTMEIADTLYGVSMRGGVSRVVAHRMREAVAAG